MTKEDVAYIKETEAWLAGQKLSIESCELKIKHLKEQNELNKKAIAAEKKELRLKKATYEIVSLRLSQFNK